MKSLSIAAVAALTLLTLPLTALGQERNNGWGGRGFVTFNVGGQTRSPDFSYDYATTLFDQISTGSASVKTPGKPGLTFDIGGGLRLVQNLGVSVAYSRYSEQRTGTLSATISDPFTSIGMGGPPSTFSKDFPFQREENAVHLQAMYRIPIGSRVQVGMFGGPSYFRCVDDHVVKFSMTSDIFPWTIGLDEATLGIDRGSAWGYNGGVTVTTLANKHAGIGMTLRYSHATHTTMNHLSDTTNLDYYGIWGGDSGTVSTKMTHGGLQLTGGFSVHF